MPIFVPFMLNMGVTPVPAHAPLRTARSCGAQRTVATMPRIRRAGSAAQAVAAGCGSCARPTRRATARACGPIVARALPTAVVLGD